jgi:hypothetical protein
MLKILFSQLYNKKKIKFKLKKSGIHVSWYEFGEKQLIMENHNRGRSEIGLLTTNSNKEKYDININDKLKWNDTFGKSTKRFKYCPFGKPVSHIERIFDIMIKVDELNKI